MKEETCSNYRVLGNECVYKDTKDCKYKRKRNYTIYLNGTKLNLLGLIIRPFMSKKDRCELALMIKQRLDLKRS